MIVPLKEYTEQNFINHNDPINRYFIIDTGSNNKILKIRLNTMNQDL